MKQGFSSLITLAEELTRQAQSKRDYIASAQDLSAIVVEGKPLLAGFNCEPLPIGQQAHRQIGTYLGIPAAYCDRMVAEIPDLWAASVNSWLTKTKDDRRMVRTLDGQVRALLSDSYKRIDNYEVSDVALASLREVPDLEIVSTAITESRLYIKAVSKAVRGEVKSKRVGDFVEAGVLITNSEIGMGALSIKPFAHFLVCTNGMVRDKSGMRAAHLGRKLDDIDGLLSEQTRRLEDAAVLSKVKDVLQAAFDEAKFREWIDSLNETTKQEVTGYVPKAVEVLGDTFGMTKGEQSLVLSHLIKGGDLSRYGVINAVTRSAEDLPSYDRATEFETIGGQLVDLPSTDWKRIAVAQ